MTKTINLKAIAGAVKSKKTPARLREGLRKKFGARLKKAGLL